MDNYWFWLMPNVPILPCAKSYFTDFIVLKVKILILQSVETQNFSPQGPLLWRSCWARNYLKIGPMGWQTFSFYHIPDPQGRQVVHLMSTVFDDDFLKLLSMASFVWSIYNAPSEFVREACSFVS